MTTSHLIERAGAMDFSNAYEGAREDLAIWKRRALEAERDLRTERETSARLAAELNAQNGPTHMGEPAPQATAPKRFTGEELHAISCEPITIFSKRSAHADAGDAQ